MYRNDSVTETCEPIVRGTRENQTSAMPLGNLKYNRAQRLLKILQTICIFCFLLRFTHSDSVFQCLICFISLQRHTLGSIIFCWKSFQMLFYQKPGDYRRVIGLKIFNTIFICRP